MDAKLIIWDLDDTLWSGTLAEGDAVRLNPARAEFVRALNRCGVVNSICSKNDPAAARGALEDFGLWEEFVFPAIAFVPKADAVRQIIADMQLRAADVVFVDDNRLNLEAVRHLLPDITVLDATLPECDAHLRAILHRRAGVTKSRVGEYRILESKLADRRQAAGSNEDFLRSCDIHVAMIPAMDNLDFTDRIEEVINRTNQMNFLKTRVEPGAMRDFIAHIRNACYSVVVWDKYGHHGIVGVAAVHNERSLKHFAFSCRVMHMGVEQFVLARLQRLYPKLDRSTVPVEPEAADWIRYADWGTPAVRARILAQERPEAGREVLLRVMMNCQSGAVTHYSGLSGIAVFDNMPRMFALRSVLDGSHGRQDFPPFLVYGALSDYANQYWPGALQARLDNGLYDEAARRFSAFVAGRDARMLVLLPPDNAADQHYAVPGDQVYGVTRARVAAFNALWRDLARRVPGLEVLDLSELAGPHDLFDVRHYTVPMLKRLGDCVAHWFARTRTRHAADAA